MTTNRYVSITGNQKTLETAIDASAGVADAGKIVATDSSGKLDPSLLPDSEVTIRVAGETLAARDFVNVYDDAGTAKVRKADASSFATRATAFVRDNVANAANAKIYGEGILGGFAGLTIGSPVFLSTTSGEITQTPPTAAGEIWQMVGEAISATEVRVEIEDAIVL